LFAQAKNFVGGRAGVFLRLMIEWRKLGMIHGDLIL